MVTKGLDFPRVTLVGVVSADTALNVPDFRASERTFQLLAQVAGRAGRGATPGRVLVQTLAADDIAITTAAQHDFGAFVTQEIENRAQIPNPPFSHAVNIVSSHEEEAQAKAKLERLALRLQDAIAREGGGTDLLGPVSCPIARVKNKFRFHLLLPRSFASASASRAARLRQFAARRQRGPYGRRGRADDFVSAAPQ